MSHPIVNDFESLNGGKANKISIFRSVLLMNFFVAGHHGDDIANPSFLEHVEDDLILANIDVEFDVVVVFYPAFVHYILYF